MTSLPRLDGVYVGHAGGTYEVFDPRWWQVWRWVAWARSKRAKGLVTFDTRLLGGRVVSRTVRVWEAPRPPRVRIEDQFKRPPIV